MGQSINYEDVCANCQQLFDLGITVCGIADAFKNSYIFTENQGNFSETFEQFKDNVDNIIVEIGGFMDSYANLVLDVMNNYQQIDQEMKTMINNN